MTRGTIAAWNKAAGDSLKAGDVLCEIETDKASVGFEVRYVSVFCFLTEIQSNHFLLLIK